MWWWIGIENEHALVVQSEFRSLRFTFHRTDLVYLYVYRCYSRWINNTAQ